jgi:D-serine deaminase-like pyridoxal phosphate-dependent protein
MALMKIDKPTLLLDKHKCLKNIEKMANKAQDWGVSFRPHFKTHQSRIVGRYFKEFGVNKITVSSVSMANYFISDGWEDINIAFPFNILETENINIIPEKIKLNILIDHIDQIHYLNENLKRKLGFFIKTNHGYNRAGVEFNNHTKIYDIIKKANPKKLDFKGFLTHNGDSYHLKNKNDIISLFNKTTNELNELRKTFTENHFNTITSIGDTPGCSLSDKFSNVDEIRPGNFVFYDLMQKEIDACTLDDIAVCMACPLVSIYPERNEALIYGGAIHFSKDFLEINNQKVFGQVVFISKDGWIFPEKTAYLKRISQEHGIIEFPEYFQKQLKIGDLVGIIPIHSCLTVDSMKKYFTLEGEKISTL